MCESPCTKPSYRSLKSIGNYSLTGCQLGKGSFARVELANHNITGLKVALKIFDPSKIGDGSSKGRLYREASILKRLRHHHIIHLYETLRYNDIYCLVTEAVFGGNLKTFIRKQKFGVLRDDVSRKFFKQLTSAVLYLHSNGIIHRDLKTDNILLSRNHEIIKLADFGLGNKFTFDQLLHTHCGSPEYAAPELFKRGGYHGPAVDIWSMGVVLFAMLMGKLPFSPDQKSLNAKEELLTLLSKGYTSLHRQTTRKLSIGSQYLLENTLESDPNKRLTIHGVMNSSWLCKDRTKNVTSQQIPISIENEVKQKTIGLLGVTASQLGDLSDPRRCDSISATYNILLDNTINKNSISCETSSMQCKPLANLSCKRNGSGGGIRTNRENSAFKNNCASRSCSIPSPRTRLRRKDNNQLCIMGSSKQGSKSKTNKQRMDLMKESTKSAEKTAAVQCPYRKSYMTTKSTTVTAKTPSNVPMNNAQSVSSNSCLTDMFTQHQDIIKQMLSSASDNPMDINRIRHLVTQRSNMSSARSNASLQTKKNQPPIPLRNEFPNENPLQQKSKSSDHAMPFEELEICSNISHENKHKKEKDIVRNEDASARFMVGSENHSNEEKVLMKGSSSYNKAEGQSHKPVKETHEGRSNSPYMARMMSHRIAMPMASAGVYTGQPVAKLKQCNASKKIRSRSVPITRCSGGKSDRMNMKPRKIASENKMCLGNKIFPIPDDTISVRSSPIATPNQTPQHSRPTSKCQTESRLISRSRPSTSYRSVQSTSKVQTAETSQQSPIALLFSHKQIPVHHTLTQQSDTKAFRQEVDKKQSSKISTELCKDYNEKDVRNRAVQADANDQLKNVWRDTYEETMIDWYKRKHSRIEDKGLALVQKVYYNIDGAIKESDTKHCKTDLHYRLGIARNENVYNRK